MPAKDHKPKKFDYARLKESATSPDRAVRKEVFVEYFTEFHEYPSYLFDNEREIHADLWQTAQDILNDKTMSRDARKGVDEMLNRLPFRQ